MIHQIVNVWCIVLTAQEQTHYINLWRRSSVALILIFSLTTHNGKLQRELVTVTSTCAECKDTLISTINTIAKHSFLDMCQANFLRAKKESLKVNEIIVLGDFAENYQFLVPNEIQSYHWSKESCTLYQLVVYFIGGDGNI